MKIVSKLIEYGLIKEFNDWQTHFLNGTKGAPRTEPIIIDYVKALLEEVFPDQPDKVKNCKLAPWLIAVVKNIGPENIDTAQRNKMLDVANWFKMSGNEVPLKNKDLNGAHEYVISKKVKETREEPKRDDNEFGPLLEAEQAGRIRKIGSVGDGRIWVEVLDTTWLGEPSELNPHHKWGVNCQSTPAHGFWSDGMLNVQLVGPPNGNPNGKWSTQIAIAGPKGSGDIKEVKQEGNQQPGSQRTSGGYSDGADVIVNFLCTNPFAKQNFKRFIKYHGGVPERIEANTFGGDTFLIYLAKPNTADLFNKLMDCREDILENNRDLVIALKGLDWFEERTIDVNDLAETNPQEYLKRFERLFNRWGKKAVEALKKIDFKEVFKENETLFKSSLPSLIGRVTSNDFITLFNMVNVQSFINTNPEDFKKIVKLMSNDKAYSEILEKIYDMNPEYFFSLFGKGTMGVIKFLAFASSPRLREHEDAVYDKDKEQYSREKPAYKKNPDGSIMRDSQGNRIIDYMYKVWIPENLLVMEKKERKKFIEKNKDFIQSLIKGNDFEKQLTYLKVLLPQLSEQEAKKLLETNNLKEQIINYYDQLYDQFQEDRKRGEEFIVNKYGRRVEGFSTPLVHNYKPGVLEFYDQFKIGEPQSRKTPLSELLASFNKIKNYETELSLQADKNNKPNTPKSNDQKSIENYKRELKDWTQKNTMAGFAKALERLKDNGMSDEQIIKIIDNSIAKSNITSPYLLKFLFSRILQLFKKSKAISQAEKLKPLFDKIGGQEHFKDLMQDLSILTFNVNAGDRIMFKGNEKTQKKFNLTSGKKYLVIETRNTYKKDLSEEEMNNLENIMAINSEVMVTEDDMGQGYGGQNIWVPSDRFDVRYDYKLYSEKLTESFREFGDKLKKLKESLAYPDSGKKPRYTAIVLDDSSMQRLESLIDELKEEGIVGEDWKISADHVTINMGGAKNPSMLGRQINFSATALGYDEMVAAVKVYVGNNIDFENRKPHVTLAFNKNEGGKPVMSNHLRDWAEIREIRLSGTIEEVY